MRHVTLRVAAALALFAGTAVASGTAGALDPTFGGGDGVAVEAGIDANLGGGVAIDAEGRTVAVGYTTTPTTMWWVGRFTTSGALDTTFAGGAGYATFLGREAWAVAIDGSGRILVAGGAYWTSGTGKNKTTQTDFTLIRLLPNGTLDSTFGTGGMVHTDFGNPNDVAFEILVQDDGNIVVAGQSGYAYGGPGLAMARYLPTGALDATFGGGTGKRTHSLGLTSGSVNLVAGLRRDSSGRFLTTVSGKTPSDTNFQAYLVRVLANGDLDTSFAMRKLQAPYSTDWKYMSAKDLLLQPDGKIVVAGAANSYAAVRLGFASRMNDDGTPDSSFATGGLFVTPLPTGTSMINVGGVLLAADGKLLVATNRAPVAGTGNQVAVVLRLDASGALDPTFGTGGVSEAATYPPAPTGAGCNLGGLALDPATGKVVGGGVAIGHPMLARWLTQ
jgi:uncharacterized delta-60 repeat protein